MEEQKNNGGQQGNINSDPVAVPQPQQSTQTFSTKMMCPKDRVSAAILAILLGSFGIHKFYLGNVGLGVLYLCFCWTGIPGFIGLIEGIVYLTKTDDEFCARYVK